MDVVNSTIFYFAHQSRRISTGVNFTIKKSKLLSVLGCPEGVSKFSWWRNVQSYSGSSIIFSRRRMILDLPDPLLHFIFSISYTRAPRVQAASNLLHVNSRHMRIFSAGVIPQNITCHVRKKFYVLVEDFPDFPHFAMFWCTAVIPSYSCTLVHTKFIVSTVFTMVVSGNNVKLWHGFVEIWEDKMIQNLILINFQNGITP